jgi:hypothetical protein
VSANRDIKSLVLRQIGPNRSVFPDTAEASLMSGFNYKFESIFLRR